MNRLSHTHTLWSIDENQKLVLCVHSKLTRKNKSNWTCQQLFFYFSSTNSSHISNVDHIIILKKIYSSLPKRATYKLWSTDFLFYHFMGIRNGFVCFFFWRFIKTLFILFCNCMQFILGLMVRPKSYRLPIHIWQCARQVYNVVV